MYVFFAHPEEDEAAHRVNLVEAGEAEDLIPERLGGGGGGARRRARSDDAFVRDAEKLVVASLPSVRRDPSSTSAPGAVRAVQGQIARSRAAARVVPMSSAWGFGRARWDVASRVYGRAPRRRRRPRGETRSPPSRARWRRSTDVPLVYPGALLRGRRTTRPPLGLEARRYLDATKTVPDDFMMELIERDADARGLRRARLDSRRVPA